MIKLSHHIENPLPLPVCFPSIDNALIKRLIVCHRVGRELKNKDILKLTSKLFKSRLMGRKIVH